MKAGLVTRPTLYLDLDGCVIDSRASIAASVDEALRRYGLAALAADEIDGLIGPPILAGFERLLARRNSSQPSPAQLVATFRERYAVVSLTQTTLFPGMEAALEALGTRAALVVVTSKARFLAVPILEALGIADRFEAIFGPAPDRPAEPKTETLARALAGRPRTAGECMIGDRSHDIDAGRAHDMPTIGVTWGSGSAAELTQAGADYVVDDPADLAPVCASIARLER
uniref:5'-nucleotidase n=1 Tax=uncultured organism TaxID=155900 RepID=A0A7L9QCV1_9ZZZZ|nr:5'-nucleotidase [uncultured organism]